MFSTEQKIFGILFALAFITFIVWSYRKDLKIHKLHYKNVWIIGIAIFIIIGLFAVLTFTLHE